MYHGVNAHPNSARHAVPGDVQQRVLGVRRWQWLPRHALRNTVWQHFSPGTSDVRTELPETSNGLR